MHSIEQRLPDWLWSPRDHWARFKGVGRIAIFLGLVGLFVGLEAAGATALVAGVACYGVGLLGMRMALERRRKQC